MKYLPKNSIWLWRLQNCEKGDFGKVIQKCLDHNIDCVLVKAGDATRNSQWSVANAKVMIDKCHNAGLKIGIWCYNKPTTWESEAKYLIDCIKEGIDVLALDPEIEYREHPQNALIAEQFMQTLRSGVGNDFTIVFAPFAIPQFHPAYPYKQFLKYCDAVMGQAYWCEMGKNVKDLISLHDTSWHSFFLKNPTIDDKPIIPILNTYGSEYGKMVLGKLTKEDLLTFMEHYKYSESYNFPWNSGFSSYSYDAANPLFWEALYEFNEKNKPVVEPIKKPEYTVVKEEVGKRTDNTFLPVKPNLIGVVFDFIMKLVRIFYKGEKF